VLHPRRLLSDFAARPERAAGLVVRLEMNRGKRLIKEKNRALVKCFSKVFAKGLGVVQSTNIAMSATEGTNYFN